MAVCLALERYVEIRLPRVAVLNQTDSPLHHVPYIKRYIEHIPHLEGMDIFVVEHSGVALTFGEDYPEQIDCEVIAERDDSVADYFHILTIGRTDAGGTTFSPRGACGF